MARYYITDPAASDLADLWDGHVERGGTEENADRLIDDLFETFQTLADFSDLGTPRDYLFLGVLAFPHDKHMVFFCKTDYGVDIDRILYGSIDFEHYFSEDE